MSSASPITDFELALSQQLELLKPGAEERVLSLEWIGRGLDFALDKHKKAVQLVPASEFPESPSDERWMNHYFDQTIRILDACNALSANMSDIEQGQLLLRYAVHTLGDRNVGFTEDKLLAALKTLREWMDTIKSPQHAKANIQRLNSLLEGVYESLPEPLDRDAEKDNNFWVALYGANATVVVTLSVLSLALTQSVKTLPMSLPLPSESLWSASILHLLQLAREEARQCISSGSMCCLGELNMLHNCVSGLLSTLESVVLKKKFPLAGEQADNLNEDIQGLRQRMDVLAGGLELVGRLVNEIFQAVVASRSALLNEFVKHDL